LRRAFPLSTISLLIEERFEPLMRKCPYINEIILCNRQRDSFGEMVRKLKERKLDISIDLKNNTFTHLLSFFAGISKRYGFQRGLSGRLLNFPEELSKAVSEEPIQQQYRILQKLGVSAFNDKLELWVTQENRLSVDKFLREEGVTKEDKVIGLAIGASNKWPTKNWPIENFIELSERLLKKGYRIILLGDEHSRNKVQLFPSNSQEKVIDFVGRTNLEQLIALIERLDVLICPDSAPLHIGSAVGTKTIAFFGPTDPKKHLPPGANIDVIVKQVGCQPCYKRKCINRKQQFQCLKEISVDEVFSVLIKKL